MGALRLEVRARRRLRELRNVWSLPVGCRLLVVPSVNCALMTSGDTNLLRGRRLRVWGIGAQRRRVVINGRHLDGNGRRLKFMSSWNQKIWRGGWGAWIGVEGEAEKVVCRGLKQWACPFWGVERNDSERMGRGAEWARLDWVVG